MVFLIFYKWTIDWGTSKLPDSPSLITVLIKMFLSPGTVDKEVQVFESQSTQVAVQVLLLLLLVLSIPTMLCVKPCILTRRKSKQMHHQVYVEMPSIENSQEHDIQDHIPEEYSERKESIEMNEINHEDSESSEHKGHQQGGHSNSSEEIVIHQLIHTIEYVLGTISNTASYLRLWALSLAHAELSAVFFDKTLKMTLGSTGAMAVIMNVVSAAGFLMFTCGVLLIMDVLECFLHALRLHWVEFQNKFFYADGRAFRPFSFAKLLEKS